MPDSLCIHIQHAECTLLTHNINLKFNAYMQVLEIEQDQALRQLLLLTMLSMRLH